MKTLAALTLSLFLSAGMALADSPKDASPEPAKAATPAKAKAAKRAEKSEKADSAIAAQLEELRQALQAQQEQLQLLKEELAKRDRQIDEAREAAAAANSRAAEATTKAVEAVNTTAEVKSSAVALNTAVSDLRASNEALKTTVEKEQADAQKAAEEGPTTIRYKGVSITPGGFIEAATIFRSRAVSGDINTPFTAIPYSALDLAHVDENNFTARQSRLTLLAESKINATKLTGYFEMDFLGSGTTSNNRQTNSYVFRQRQLWGQATLDNGFQVTGGQMWSLVTEDRKGIQNRQEDLPMMIDPQYVVGFTWARQYGLRLEKDFHGKFVLAFSVEGPQATIGGRGFSTVTTVNDAAGPSTILTSSTTATTNLITGNFFINAPGNNAGLYDQFDITGYTVNKAPDLIFKAAADPGFGHYELFGIVSFFRDRVYPCGVVGTRALDTIPNPANFTGPCTSPTPTVVSSFGAYNSEITGGGMGASALWSALHKHVDFGVKAVGGDGIGRYGSAQLADATARPNGTLSLIRTAHGLARVELHPSPKFDIYGYWGLEYAWRAGYAGYQSITVTKTPAIPGVVGATTATSIAAPNIGGYANFAANNSGCATEGVTLNQFNPSSGSNCAGDIRIIQEATLGFWHKFYQGPRGGMRWGIQYSYFVKNAWSGTGGGVNVGPKAVDNMLWTSFRYYLP